MYNEELVSQITSLILEFIREGRTNCLFEAQTLLGELRPSLNSRTEERTYTGEEERLFLTVNLLIPAQCYSSVDFTVE